MQPSHNLEDNSSDSGAREDAATEHNLGALVERFSERLRAGETPDIGEFVALYPEHEQRIRELLETIASLEQARASLGASREPQPALARIAEYVLERELGRGGMGIVYLARDATLGRLVALKLLPLQATLDERFLERFQREARAAALLQHAHIVPVYGVGAENGVHYYAMRYIEGQSLDVVVRSIRELESRGGSPSDASPLGGLARQIMTRELSGSASDADAGAECVALDARESVKPSDPLLKSKGTARRTIYYRNVARMGLQVADALDYAHNRGILHRDIKPANLLLDAQGCTWVTDFGLCKIGDEDGLTMATDLVGTLRYLAPEKVDGEADVRSDVYELGVTLYELCTLRPAFDGKERAGLLNAVLHSTPQRPRKLRPDLPRDLESILLKAIARLPEERYGTAGLLAQDLRQFLAGRAVSARPPSALHLARLLVRRNRLLSAMVLAFLLLLVLATTLYLEGMARARAEQSQQLYSASIAAAEATLAHNPELARAHLQRAPPGQRGWEWRHLSARLDDSLRTLERMEFGVRGLDIDRFGERLVFMDLKDTLHVRELGATGQSWSVASNGGSFSIAPDGRTLVNCGTLDAQVWSLEHAPSLLASRALGASVFSIAYDASGERVFLGATNGNVYCFDALLNQELFVLTGYPNWILSLALSADDRFLVAGLASGVIRVTELASKQFRDLAAHFAGVDALDVAPDGLRFASGGRDGVVKLWDFDAETPIRVWQTHAGKVNCVRFSPDGELFVSTSSDRAIGVHDARAPSRSSATSSPPASVAIRKLRGHNNEVWNAAFLPTGNLISTDEDGLLKEWDPGVAGGLLQLEGHVADVFGVAFSADARRLLSWNRDATLRQWDAETGALLRVYMGPQTIPLDAAFSPDQASIAVAYMDGGLRIWDQERSELLQELFYPCAEGARRGPLYKLDYGPSGNRLYATDRERLHVWERRGSEYAYAFGEEVPGVHGLALSDDGRLAALSTQAGEVLVFSTQPWRLFEARRTHASSVSHLSFVPGGATLLSAGDDGLVCVWNLETGAPSREIRVVPRSSPRGSAILGLDVGADGKRFLVSTLSAGASLWNLGRGEKLISLRGAGRNDYPYSAFSQNGERVATGTSDGRIMVWDTLGVEARRERMLRSSAQQEQAVALVEGWFAELRNYDLVKRRIMQPNTLGAALREQALRVAHERSGSLDGLLHRGQRLLRSPEGKQGAYKGPWIHGLDLRTTRLMGEAELRRGNLSRALAHLESIVNAGQTEGEVDLEARILLAMTYAKLERHADARDMLEPARAQLGGSDPMLIELLGEAQGVLCLALE